MPPIARPSPPSVPPERAMSRLDMNPRMTAGMPARAPKHPTMLKMPSTSDAIALPSFCGGGVKIACGTTGGG